MKKYLLNKIGKLSSKSKIVLTILMAVSVSGMYVVESFKVNVKQKWYEDKLEAAQLSKTAQDYLREVYLQKGVFIDIVNDPNKTALIGQDYTLTTTDRGDIKSKLSSLNPNFAAVIVDMFKEAGLEKNDKVAVGCTGSFPGLNIALLAAAEVLHLDLIIITSVGSSNFGANDPYFTWLDMETELHNKGIFTNHSLAASIGGGADIGRGLSPEGRELIINAIKRNKVKLIYEDYLEGSIKERLKLYSEKAGGIENIKAYVNIGGGIASLGSTVNGKIIPSGFSEHLNMRNFPVRGVIVKMAQEGKSIIHLLKISSLLKKYELPNSPVPLPKPGTGAIFVQKKYNELLTLAVTVILVLILSIVYLIERKNYRLGTELSEDLALGLKTKTKIAPKLINQEQL